MTIRPTSLMLLIFIAILGVLLLDTPHSGVSAARDDDAYEEEVVKGKDLLRRRQYEDALKSFKRANELRGKKSAECFNLMSEAYLGLGAHKNVLESAEKVLEFAGDDKQLILNAYNNKGLALQALAERKDQKKLQAAEAAFRQALTLEGAWPVIRYNLGVTLLQLNRDAEGVEEINQYIKAQPNGAYIADARKMAENPRRARENYAPDFSFTSSQGEYISLEDLRGKVVVLDFWGTWCPPCVDSVPSLRSMHKKYSKEPSFVLLGISSDREEDVWKEFTEKNKMVWPQFLDKDRRIHRAFGIRAFPTYIVIDHEGIVRFSSVGASWERSVDLHSAIQKAVKIVAKSTEAQ
ncbi:MAG TPA: redoxin domain-containing protein [Pyrinomonadaceae bacterium]|nr:redoxin domain-containing protein [Pyrinomonadaceae bacterium]